MHQRLGKTLTELSRESGRKKTVSSMLHREKLLKRVHPELSNNLLGKSRRLCCVCFHHGVLFWGKTCFDSGNRSRPKIGHDRLFPINACLQWPCRGVYSEQLPSHRHRNLKGVEEHSRIFVSCGLITL